MNWQRFKDSNATVGKKVFDTQNSLKSCTYLGQRIGEVLRTGHRVGRVLSFFSSRRNWDSPNPSSAGEYAPPTGSGGRGTLAGERRGERVPIQFRRGDIHSVVVLFIYRTYFVEQGNVSRYKEQVVHVSQQARN